jgi:hypothetical protein
MLRDDSFKEEIVALAGRDTKSENGEGGAGKKVMDSTAAAQVRASINSSLEDVKKRGKLTHKEAMEIMVSYSRMRLNGRFIRVLRPGYSRVAPLALQPP